MIATDPYAAYGRSARGFTGPSPIIEACERIRDCVSLSSLVSATVKLRRVGGEWSGCCPFHADRSPSFTIWASDRRFQCFGCGAQGDALDYIRRAHSVDLVEAIRMIDAGALPVVERNVSARTTDSAVDDRTPEAVAIWTASAPADGTPVATYLASRALPGPVPDALRFARLKYGARGDTHPCMVALIVDAGGNPQGIQRTYLNASGTGKASMPKPKLSLGRVKGGAVRLAPADNELIVTEGIEDSLSLLLGSGVPAWAAAGAGMLPAMILPASVLCVTIGADADAAGEHSAQQAAARFHSEGRQARIMRPAAGFKDFNAELMGAGL